MALFALGSMVQTAEKVAGMLEEQGIKATVINARFAVPFDKDRIVELTQNHKLLVTMEENVTSGGFGEHVASFVNENDLDIKVQVIALPDAYVEHGNVDRLKEDILIDATSVYNRILDLYKQM